MVQKGNLAKNNLKANFISEIKEVMSTKINVHAFDINPYLHNFLKPILFD